MEKIFVIGDVHGCIYTLKKLLVSWQKEKEQLIFVGDLIDRGNFSPETVDFVKRLCKKEDAICLMGNHEFACYRAILERKEKTWFRKMGEETIAQYAKSKFKLEKDAKWFQELPLIWQNGNFIISHAGISKAAINPFDKNNSESVLWTRTELKVYENKIQIHGHTPSYENPFFKKETQSWNIDSAAVYSHFLTGLKFYTNGDFIEEIKVKTFKEDVPRKYDLSE